MSSTSRLSSRWWILPLRPLDSRNSLNAKAVVANPPGTDTPAPERLLIISPRDAFLPPTRSTSCIPSCSYQSTYCCTCMSPGWWARCRHGTLCPSLCALLSLSSIANDRENVFYLWSKKSPSKIWGWSNDPNILQCRHKKITTQVC